MKIDASLNELDLIVNEFNKSGIYLLQGNLASGKTTLVNAIAKKFLNKFASSPTFSVMNTYTDNLNYIYHYDIYQKGTKAFIENGLYENLFNDGLHLIEWADDDFIKILEQFSLAYKIVKITPSDKGRLYEFS